VLYLFHGDVDLSEMVIMLNFKKSDNKDATSLKDRGFAHQIETIFAKHS